jgi:hypothetical protein
VVSQHRGNHGVKATGFFAIIKSTRQIFANATMITCVLIFNVLLSIACFYVAGQIWQFRQALVQTVAALTVSERATYDVLHGAPEGIMGNQVGINQLRQSYSHMEFQLEQLRRVTQLLSLGLSVWSYRRHLPGLKRRRRLQTHLR